MPEVLIGIDSVLLVMSVVLAAAAVWTRILRHAVIYLGLFSFLCSFLYLYYGAPDVAIAEAVIGSGLVMLLYLTAIKRYRTYTVIVSDETVQRIEDSTMRAVTGSDEGKLLTEIENFCISRELEPELVFTRKTVSEVIGDGRFDLIVHRSPEGTRIMGRSDNFLVDELEMVLILHASEETGRFVRLDEEVS
jgi:putative multicomponent Na+:H+ antiporter subunit B